MYHQEFTQYMENLGFDPINDPGHQILRYRAQNDPVLLGYLCASGDLEVAVIENQGGQVKDKYTRYRGELDGQIGLRKIQLRRAQLLSDF